MTTHASVNMPPTDADLVSASRSGDRGAFGHIVRRYQAMISGLAYAACGDLHRGEDIAQETFVSAWKSLSGLRDSTRLPGWLCRIARRRLADSARKTSASEVPFSHAFTLGQEPPVAATEPRSAEECEFLWHTLSHIPQPYRETLVLFYRQEQSTAQVAAAMETTEAAVRQRLTRGRQMLREELAAVLERHLAATAPNPRFTMQVVAALPALTAQSAGLGAAAKGAAAVKGGGLATILLCWLAPVGCVYGLIYGTLQDVRQSKSPRLRRLALLNGVSQFLLIAGWVVGFNLLVAKRTADDWDPSTIACVYSASTCLFGGLFFTVAALGRWRIEKALRDEGITESPFPKTALWQRLVFTVPVVAIFLGWMIQLAMKAGDQTGVAIIASLIIVQSIWFGWRVPQLQPDRPIQQTFETFTFSLLVIVAMLNWRHQIWLGADIPAWSFNLGALILFAWTGGLTVWDRRRRHEV